MKRIVASSLALGLAAVVGTASAQTYGQPYGGYTQPAYGQTGYSDVARVIRVVPVNAGYTQTTGNAGQRCYQQRTYAEGDPRANDPRYNGGYYGNGGYPDGGYNNGGYYGQQPAYGSSTGRTVATIVGGLVGAAVGSQVGGGSARYATSAIGSTVGAMAGQRVYEANARRRAEQNTGYVTVCDPVPANGGVYGNNAYYPASNGQAMAYDVTYEYAGRQYTTRTSYNPGSTIRVRVNVNPE